MTGRLPFPDRLPFGGLWRGDFYRALRSIVVAGLELETLAFRARQATEIGRMSDFDAQEVAAAWRMVKLAEEAVRACRQATDRPAIEIRATTPVAAVELPMVGEIPDPHTRPARRIA